LRRAAARSAATGRACSTRAESSKPLNVRPGSRSLGWSWKISSRGPASRYAASARRRTARGRQPFYSLPPFRPASWRASRPAAKLPHGSSRAPPGGTLRQRIRHALEDGRSVLVFPDGPPGVPAHLSRFRLDAIHAALETSTPIYPIGIRNGRQGLEGSRNSGLESRNSKLETG